MAKQLDNKALREKAEARSNVMEAFRSPFDKANRDVARAILPVLSSYVSRGNGSRSSASVTNFHSAGSGNGVFNMIGQPEPNGRLYNSAAPRAWEICSTGLAGGLSSSSQPWFKLQPLDRKLRDVHSVKVWFDAVNDEVRSFLGQTNIYEEMQKGYGELTWAGTEATLFTGHYRYGAVAHNLTWGSYWLGVDDGGRTNTLLRDAPMTVEQLIQRIGSIDEAKKRVSQTVKSLIEKEKFGALVPVRHLIEPNDNIVFGSALKENKPYRSMYYEPGEPSKEDRRALLSLGGFDRKPFATPRWHTYGQTPYGWGPGMHALPESRKVQIQEIRYQTGLDYGVRPALQAPVQGMGTPSNLIPGGITYTAGADQSGGMRPIYEVPAQMLQVLGQDIQGRTEQAINRAFYTDLFTPIMAGFSGTQPRTAEEIMSRNEESLRQIGPVLDRIQTEKLSVIVLQAFSILSETGRLPPLPEELEGTEMTIEYVSMLAQAQRMVGLGNIERAIGFLGSVAAAQPTVVDLVDLDETVIEYWDRLGMSAKSLRNMEDVAADRQARAQQEQMAQMASMMPAAKDGADAARLMAETAQMGGAMSGLLDAGV